MDDFGWRRNRIRLQLDRRGIDRQGSDEAVATFRQGLDKARMFRIILQRDANLADGEAQALLKVYEGFGIPDLLKDFLARNDFSCMRNKQDENLRGLQGQLYQFPIPAQFPRTQVQLKVREAN